MNPRKITDLLGPGHSNLPSPHPDRVSPHEIFRDLQMGHCDRYLFWVRKEITYLKLNWKSDSHLPDFGDFFSVLSAFPSFETNDFHTLADIPSAKRESEEKAKEEEWGASCLSMSLT